MSLYICISTGTIAQGRYIAYTAQGVVGQRRVIDGPAPDILRY